MPSKKTDKTYLSLKEATKYCDYSQEYLSLRARQGKLKAIKFGRNWVTTKDWISEYIDAVTEYHNNRQTGGAKQKTFQPPPNLPIQKVLDSIGERLGPEMKIRFGFVMIFTISCLIASITFGQKSIKSTYYQTNYFNQAISQEIDEKAIEIAEAALLYTDKLINFWAPDIAETIKSHVEAYIVKAQEQILQYYNSGAVK